MPDTTARPQAEIDTAVATLRDLLRRRYPEAHEEVNAVDFITLEEVRSLYRLTGLGEPANQAIEQARRIAQAGGDYQRIGLCEFHVGLIYLHYGRLQGAAYRFAAAARQWSFIDATPSLCLALFAEGKAEEFSYRYEAALTCYNKASQRLDRIQYEPDSQRWQDWAGTLQNEIGRSLRQVRRLLRKYPDEEDEEDEEEAKAEPSRPARSEAAPAAERKENIVIPPPLQNPLPAHQKVSEDHHWYQITERAGLFLNFLPQGAWLLVQTRDLHPNRGDLLIVGGEESFSGSITVRSRSHHPPFSRIRLARVPLEGPFIREGETVKLLLDAQHDQTVEPDDVVGLVVGYWLERHLVQNAR